MTFALTNVVRTSSIDPIGNPLAFDISYTGATGPVLILEQHPFGVFTTIGTGGGGSATVSVTSAYDFADHNNGTLDTIGFQIKINDSANTVESPQFCSMPLAPAPFTVTPLSTFQFSFAQPVLYNNEVVTDPTPPDFDLPYDYWINSGGLNTTEKQPNPISQFYVLAAPMVSYLWDFGDGNTSTSPTPTHTYGGPGVYDARLYFFYDAGLLPTTRYGSTLIIIDGALGGWHVGHIGMGGL